MESFTGQADDVDTTAPTVADAWVIYKEITVTFNEAPDPGSAPAGDAFTVSYTRPAATRSRTLPATTWRP